MKTKQVHKSRQTSPNQQDVLENSNQFKKNIILPPIKNKSQIIPSQIIEQRKKSQKIVQKQKESQPKKTQKQRKFVLDQYDEKAIILCQFCGGQKCPQQDYLTNKIQPNAIQGLHSNWISQNILAMQRPSNHLIQKFKLLQQFHKYNINTILNLQQPGQHPYCGPGIDPLVGFSYDPQLFFSSGIRFQNQYWEDMTSTSFQQMMKIMNIFYRSIVQKRGKISVHCHAGRGRTLMAICAWLIYHDRMTAQETISLAVQKRQGVLTRTSQRDFLRDFQSQIQRRWKSYSHQLGSEHLKTYTEFIEWQYVSLLKNEKQKLNQTSFVHGTIINLLRNRMKQHHKQIIFAFIDLNNETFGKKWDKQHEHRAAFLKTYIDRKKLQKIAETQQIRILTTLFQDFYDNLPFTPISLHAVDILRKQSQTQESILKNKGIKRQVTKVQNIESKILKKWQDIVSQRPQNLGNRSPTKQSKLKQQTKQNTQQKQQQNIKQNQQGGISNNTNFLKLQTRNNFAKNTNGSFNKSQNNFSDIEISSFYLNILTQPAVIHEVGFHSLTTLIDMVRFVKDLMEIYKQSHHKQNQTHFQLIERCILTKFSIILQSKKKYFPVLFRGQNQRQSKLMQKIQKIQKYSNQNIVYLASFMKNLMQQLPTDERQFQKLIIKLQKVDANVDYFAKSFSNTGGKFFSVKDAQKVYDQSRI